MAKIPKSPDAGIQSDRPRLNCAMPEPQEGLSMKEPQSGGVAHHNISRLSAFLISRSMSVTPPSRLCGPIRPRGTRQKMMSRNKVDDDPGCARNDFQHLRHGGKASHASRKPASTAPGATPAAHNKPQRTEHEKVHAHVVIGIDWAAYIPPPAMACHRRPRAEHDGKRLSMLMAQAGPPVSRSAITATPRPSNVVKLQRKANTAHDTAASRNRSGASRKMMVLDKNPASPRNRMSGEQCRCSGEIGVGAVEILDQVLPSTIARPEGHKDLVRMGRDRKCLINRSR